MQNERMIGKHRVLTALSYVAIPLLATLGAGGCPVEDATMDAVDSGIVDDSSASADGGSQYADGGVTPGNGGDDQGGGQPGADNGGSDAEGDGTVPSTGSGAPQSVDESLAKLGMNTTETARVDEQGEALPTDYAPLGSAFDVAQTDELFLVGLQMIDPAPISAPQALANRAAFVELADDNTGDVGLSITELLAPGQTWEQDTKSGHPGANGTIPGAQNTRAVAAADVDRDGQDEIVIARIAPGDPNEFGDVLISILDGEADSDGAVNFSQPERVVTSIKNVRDIAIVAGDFDGDGDEEVALGVSTTTEARVLPLKLGENGVFTIHEQAVKSLPQKMAGSSISMEMATGNMDLDNASELVVVVNEYHFDSGNYIGRSRYWVFDDGLTDHASVVSEQAILVDEGQNYTAVTASVAMGDIDGDARDEIVFGGLTSFESSSCYPVDHIYLALEDMQDAANPLGNIGGATYSFNYIPTGTGCNDNAELLKIRHVFINTLDIDGDGVDEVQANLRVFDNWLGAGGPWSEIYALPTDEYLKYSEGQHKGGVISAATTDMVTGDVTGDGRDDVISFAQWQKEITVWGLDGPSLESSQWSEILTIPTAFANSQTRVFPILTACNVDKDGLALKYSEAQYKLVFTEPIIMAALAAAPCVDGISQNYDACRTAYGLSQSQNAGIDGTVTVRASTWVGGEAKVFGIGASVREKVTASASFSAGRSYQLEQTVEYTTGPREDTVICTVLPVDQYTYDVVSHPDPSMIGKTIVINMPRTPITIQVEREFFNASTPPGSFKVGKSVFLHTPGQINSYPTEADADALIDTGGLGHLGPLGELVDAAGAALGPIAEHLLGRGLKTDRVASVGANGGETSLELKFTESTDYRAGAEIDYELEAETTAGFIIGGSVGGSVEAGLSWGSINTTTYRGTVGEIAPEDFAGNGYSYGLFTYIYNYGDRSKPQFEVINYWVQR